MSITFQEYQSKFESSFAKSLNVKWNNFRKKIRKLTPAVDEMVQVPNLLIRMVSFTAVIFSYFPQFCARAEMYKQIGKDAKNFTNVLRGVKSVDGILHFQFTWKVVILNISGTIFAILSALSLIDRSQLVNLKPIKGPLSSIPIFGILPYGGLLSLSILGLMGTTVYVSLEKRTKLQKQVDFIREKKLLFWSKLDLAKVQELRTKNEVKVSKLKKELSHYEKLLEEGKQVEKQIEPSCEKRKTQSCQKAIKTLIPIITDKKKALEKSEKKLSQWDGLVSNWDHLEPKQLEDIRLSKVNQWRKKLKKVQWERGSALLGAITNMTIIARQVFSLITVTAGFGIKPMPLIFNVGLELIGITCDYTNFFLKRTIKRM